MNLNRIREEIAFQLSSTGGVSATARIPAVAELTPPHAFISDMVIRFVALGEITDIDFEVTVLISHADADTGWDTISQLCDVDTGDSIIDALLSDRSLNSEIDSLTFTEIRGMGGSYDVGGVQYLGFQMAFTAHV